jgi:hypothetical protein
MVTGGSGSRMASSENRPHRGRRRCRACRRLFVRRISGTKRPKHIPPGRSGQRGQHHNYHAADICL